MDRMNKLQIFLAEQLTAHPERTGWNNRQEEAHDASVCSKTCKLCKGFEQPARYPFFKCPKKWLIVTDGGVRELPEPVIRQKEHGDPTHQGR
ncbi:hypothetical protein CLU79DRAFT_834446 [Phycomyces nitens]|nr:hypothetical protein CLU79DRAFT_834446 [Phycomyces nitens]